MLTHWSFVVNNNGRVLNNDINAEMAATAFVDKVKYKLLREPSLEDDDWYAKRYVRLSKVDGRVNNQLRGLVRNVVLLPGENWTVLNGLSAAQYKRRVKLAVDYLMMNGKNLAIEWEGDTRAY